MKIENLREEHNRERARVAATVIWEDCDRLTHEVYFETDDEFSKDLTCNAHAFLVGCAIPALHYGEKRVSIDADICPELRDGLSTAISWLRHWYYPPARGPIAIEAKKASGLTVFREQYRAGGFFSGGVDSFATLRSNHINFPAEHPGSIKDGLLVYGLEQDDAEIFEYVKASLSMAAKEAGITLIPAYTNLYLNYRQDDAKNRFRFWVYEHTGAALAAVAHAFAKRLSVVSIPASDDIPTLGLFKKQCLAPYGTHPLLDTNYSSSDLRIRHDGLRLSRLMRTRLISEWPPALQHLRVCNRYKDYRPGMLNCGECEKCVRTMLTLLVLGVLDKTSVFPATDVTEEMVSGVRITPYFYLELLPCLKEIGRDDLVRAVKKGLADEKKRRNWQSRKDYLKQIDKKYLKGSLCTLKGLAPKKIKA